MSEEHLSYNKSNPEWTAPGPNDETARTICYKFDFTGSAGEYFRIWIVNTFLTVLTLGVYAAWAKVRSRQYFYRHTVLDNQSFDYTASPLAILKGYLIIGAGILIYLLLNVYNPAYSSIIAGFIYLLYPFLIYKSLRFYTHNSAFRNIRFRFFGTPGDCYKIYLFIPILIPLTLGLIVPYWLFEQKKYFFNNFAFGTTNNSFKGRPGSFYRFYIMGIGISLAGGALIILSFMFILNSYRSGAGPLNIISAFFPVLAAAGLFAYIQQYLYALTTNYCLQSSSLGTLRFQSTLQPGQLFWIRITNIAAIIFSLGMLIPWAKVRRMRYLFNNIAVTTEGSLNDFTAAVEPDESAYGEAAADFFDIEIGL